MIDPSGTVTTVHSERRGPVRRRPAHDNTAAVAGSVRRPGARRSRPEQRITMTKQRLNLLRQKMLRETEAYLNSSLDS